MQTQAKATTPLPSEYSQAIKLMRPILILLVCIVHMPFVLGFESEFASISNLNTFIPVIIKDFIARGAVPVLSVISGYLAYYSYLKVTSYRTFLAHKTSQLFIPFVVWNFIAFLAGLIVLKLTSHNPGDVASMNSLWGVIDGVLGLFRMPANPPIYFLRDLFLIMTALPLIHFLISRKLLLGIFLAALIYIFKDLPGVILVINESGDLFPIIYRWDTLVFFIFGYGLAFHGAFIISRSKALNTAVIVVLGLLSVFFADLILEFRPTGFAFGPWRTGFGAIFILAIPVLFALLISIKGNVLGKCLAFLSPYSFTLFLSHNLSSHIFYWLVRLYSPITISEQSPLWIQATLLTLYLAFIISFAIMVRKVWHILKAKLPTRPVLA